MGSEPTGGAGQACAPDKRSNDPVAARLGVIGLRTATRGYACRARTTGFSNTSNWLIAVARLLVVLTGYFSEGTVSGRIGIACHEVLADLGAEGFGFAARKLVSKCLFRPVMR